MGLFSQGSQTQTQTSVTEPWSKQQDYLTSGFGSAQGALDKALQFNASLTDPVADMTAGQKAAIGNITNLSGQAGALSSSMINAGYGANQAYNQYNQNNQSIYNQASQDGTQTIISNAGQYADNPYLQDQIDSAIQDVTQSFDITKGVINDNASANGNMGSTRTALAENLALEDAMAAATDISTGMRSDAYNTGLNMAQTQYNTGFDQMLAANNQFANGASIGTGMAATGYDIGNVAGQQALGAQTLYQEQEQNEINGARDLAYSDLDLVNQYMAAVGGNYGGTTTTTAETPTASTAQTLLGAGLSLAGTGAFGAGGWMIPW